MKLFNFIALVYCLTRFERVQSVNVNVPVFFVTEGDIESSMEEINYFYLRLCGGALYDKQTATVFINQPIKPWNPMISDFVKVAVFDASGHQIATNTDKSGQYVDTFPLVYSKAYGDLKFRATTAQSPGGMIYTMSVRFPSQPNQPLLNNATKVRYVSTDEEIQHMESFKKAVQIAEVGKTYELVSVFLTNTIGHVVTQGADILVLNYCFNNNELPGKIEVSVIATDEISGFGTYVCPGHVNPCTTETTPFRDRSGAATNFVTALMTQDEDDGPVSVIVRGDSRFQQTNHYKLAASKLFKNKTND